MRNLSVRLKHFKGILDGLGLDEMTLDLSGLTGLVGLVGDNGIGKTTLLDNLTSFRIMPSKVKEGKYTPGAFDYYSEVYGIAEKENVFIMGGIKYRAVLFIDCEKKKQEAYLYQEVDGAWKDLNKSGRTSTYDKAVEEILGSPQLFFNSIFRCQEAPRLNTYRKGVIKDILADLLMLDRIKEKGKAAKAVVAMLDQLVDRLKAQELVLSPEADGLAEQERKLKDADATLQVAAGTLRTAETGMAEIQQQVSAVDIELVQFKYDEEKRVRTAAQADTLRKKIEKLACSSKDLVLRHYEKYTGFREKRARIGKIIANGEAIRVKVGEETGLNNLLSVDESEMKELITAIEAAGKHTAEISRLNAQLSPLLVQQGQNVIVHQGNIDSLKKDIARIEKAIVSLEGLPCDVSLQSACPAVKTTVQEKERLGPAREKLAGLLAGTGVDATLQSKIDGLQAKIAELQLKADVKDVTARKTELNLEMQDLKKQLADMAKFTRLLPELESAEKTLMEVDRDQAASLQEHLRNIDANIVESDAAESELAGLESVLADLEISYLAKDGLTKKKSVLSAQLEAAKKDLEYARKAHTDATVSRSGLQAGVERCNDAKRKLDSVRAQIEDIQAERAAWATLERGFGNDGIIAHEIDESGPQIASLANELLGSCFGSRFTVRIDTQDIKPDGNSTEVFDISVMDSETGSVSSLSDKSGGQKTWLEDAITRAIALVNTERSGRRYHTLYTDERDGALSDGVKREFFLMKRRAMELGNFQTEFFISHTPAAQEMADRRLVFKKGEGIIVE